jgi:hypothetical protein
MNEDEFLILFDGPLQKEYLAAKYYDLGSWSLEVIAHHKELKLRNN